MSSLCFRKLHIVAINLFKRQTLKWLVVVVEFISLSIKWQTTSKSNSTSAWHINLSVWSWHSLFCIICLIGFILSSFRICVEADSNCVRVHCICQNLVNQILKLIISKTPKKKSVYKNNCVELRWERSIIIAVSQGVPIVTQFNLFLVLIKQSSYQVTNCVQLKKKYIW